jgi:hypothetical protein
MSDNNKDAAPGENFDAAPGPPTLLYSRSKFVKGINRNSLEKIVAHKRHVIRTPVSFL